MADMSDILEAIRIALDRLPDVVADAIGAQRPDPQPTAFRGFGKPGAIGEGFHRNMFEFARILGTATPALGRFVASLNDATRASGLVPHLTHHMNRMARGVSGSPWRRTGAKFGDFLRKNGWWGKIAGATFGGMSAGVFVASMLRKHGIRGLRGAALAAHRFFGSDTAKDWFGKDVAKDLRSYAAKFYKHVSSGSFGAHFSKFVTDHVSGTLGKILGVLGPMGSGGAGWVKAGMMLARGVLAVGGVAGAVIGAGSLFAKGAAATRDFAEEQLRQSASAARLSPRVQMAMAHLAIGDLGRSFRIAQMTEDSTSKLAEAVNRMRDNQVEFNAAMTNGGNILGAGAAGFSGAIFKNLGRWAKVAGQAGGGMAEGMGIDPMKFAEGIGSAIGDFLMRTGTIGSIMDAIDRLLNGNKPQAPPPPPVWNLNLGIKAFGQGRVMPPPNLRHGRP